MNVELTDIPTHLAHGVYACTVQPQYPRLAAMHYGPRPSFGDSLSCEVHVLDEEIFEAPEKISVTVHAYLRDIRKFSSTELLRKQIAQDLQYVRDLQLL